MDVISKVAKKIEEFNERVLRDEGMRKDLHGIERRINLVLGNQTWSFELKECRITLPREGGFPSPDIEIITDIRTLERVLDRETSSMRAIFIDKTLKIKAPLDDLIRLKRLLD